MTLHRLLPGVFIGSHAIAAGLISRRQLRSLGYRRLVHGVYADPSLPVDHRLRSRAVALLLPAGAAIGGHSAAAWHGAPFAAVTDRSPSLVPADLVWAGPRGVRVHRSQGVVPFVKDDDGVPVTSALRTAWDVAALEPLGTAVAALDAMVRAGTVTPPGSSWRWPLTGTGRWGVAKVRRAVPLVDPRAESPPESRVRVALVLAGLNPCRSTRCTTPVAWSEGSTWPSPMLASPSSTRALTTSRTARSSGTTPVRKVARGRMDGHPAQFGRPARSRRRRRPGLPAGHLSR